jgi:hypothetical protein
MLRFEIRAVPRALLRAARTSLARLVQVLKTPDGSAFVTIALFALPYLWLIGRYDFLPMQDLSGHIELAFLHHRLSDDDPAYAPFYRVSPQPWPNSLSTVVLSAFGSVLGFESGAKVLLSLYALAWPLSIGLLAKLLGRSPLVALFAIPTILDLNWGMGFFNYLLAKPLVVAAVCAAITFSRRPGLLRGAIVVITIWLTFLAHGLAFGLSGAWAGFAVLCFSRGVRRLLNLWPLVLTLALPARYVLAQRDAGPSSGAWLFGQWEQMLIHFWPHLGALSPSTTGDELAYLLAFAAWFLAVAFPWGPMTASEPAHARQGSVFLWVSVVALFAAYSLGPLTMPNVDILVQRFLVFSWALAMIIPLRFPAGLARYSAALLLVGAVGSHVYSMSAQYEKFNVVEMGGFSELIDMIPPGKALATHYYRTGSPFARQNEKAMWHWPKLYGVRKGGGGHSDDTFAWRSTSYVNLTETGLKNGTYAIPTNLNHARLALFDYQLTHGGSREDVIAQLSPVADYIATRSQWHLFRVRKPK